jgi:hypothetical protein
MVNTNITSQILDVIITITVSVCRQAALPVPHLNKKFNFYRNDAVSAINKYF